MDTRRFPLESRSHLSKKTILPARLLSDNVGLDMPDSITLYRPVGQHELDLIAASGWCRFPPRLPEQPIFYPVLTEAYATQIARDWNAKHNDPAVGYVTRFDVRMSYLKDREVHVVGGSQHTEYWIPADELDEFNRNIVGFIEVIGEYRKRS